VANASVPAVVSTAISASEAFGEASATTAATVSGPKMNSSSCITASRANAESARPMLPPSC
jgi:hypothetical protein